MSTTTTRARPPPAPKPPTTISPSTIISETASLTGTRPITLSAHSVIHPRAKLVSTHAPVKIGEWCIISEKASVGLLLLPHKGEENSDGGEGVELFRGVVVETGAVVEARSVGEGTVVEAGAKVGSGAVVGKVCQGLLCLRIWAMALTGSGRFSIARSALCVRWRRGRCWRISRSCMG